jgi:hypothetical protein
MTAYVYRHYDVWGRLLYIGFSMDVEARSIRHLQCSTWGDVIGRIDIARFGTRKDALAAEKRAIADESPPFNRTNMQLVKISVPFMSVGARKIVNQTPRRHKLAVDPPPLVHEEYLEVRPELQQALRRIVNVTSWCRANKLPARTIWRLRSGGVARAGTLALVNAALDRGAK